MSIRRRLVRAPLALTFLVGGLLLMHGLEGAVGGTHGSHGGTSSGAAVDDEHHAPSGAAAHCPDCVAHALAACLAVVVGLFAWRAARGPVGLVAAVEAALATGRPRERWELWHPPEPAWLRLAVMRS